MKPKPKIIEIPAAEFRNKCLKLFDEVNRHQREIVITKRGKPVARVVPVEPDFAEFFGGMRGTVEILGDIVSPSGLI